jgi:hypothetical protein
VKESGRNPVRIFSRHLLVGVEENHERIQWEPDSNRSLPHYKWVKLPVEPTRSEVASFCSEDEVVNAHMESNIALVTPPPTPVYLVISILDFYWNNMNNST